ncbi:MAG: VOC family protein [Actinomyces sp.]|nr:MAG: VOC family protein [Actinomyces sp.]
MAEFRVLYTSDAYEESVAFYTRRLGLEVVASWDDHGRGTIVAATDGGEIEIFAGDGTAEPPRGVALAWEVDDVDERFRTLAARGVEFLSPPTDQPWGHRNATLAGPDGLTITLFTVIGEEV